MEIWSVQVDMVILNLEKQIVRTIALIDSDEDIRIHPFESTYPFSGEYEYFIFNVDVIGEQKPEGENLNVQLSIHE